MQRIRDEEKLELAEDRAIDLLRLRKLVDRFGESHTLQRVNSELTV